MSASNFYAPPAQAGYIYHVKPSTSGTADGSNWDNATTLQSALGSAAGGDEIWVAQGTYLPGNARTDTFNLAQGVVVYGGFAGTELNRDDRDWAANPTILSGDIGTSNDDSDNSYHVVTAEGDFNLTTVLDGFSIVAGNANGTFPNDRGAGMFCNGVGFNHNCSPKLVNMQFMENTAVYGGAMFNYGLSKPIITNAVFANNNALTGGAIYNYGGNNYDASPNITNVTFYDNTATNDGGAIYNYGTGGTSDPQLTNVILWGNTAVNGAQIYLYDSAPTIRYAILQGGTSGIYYGGSSSNLINSIEIYNSDPLFIDPLNGNLGLQVNSLAVDKGYNNALGLFNVTTDLDANSRLVDGDGNGTTTVDFGAYEYQIVCPATTTLFVNHSAAGDDSGNDWANAQPSLTAALNNATHCDIDEIWVAAGTYFPGSNRTDSFNLVADVGVYGGFAGNETDRDARDWATNPTILSGDIGTPDDNSDNSYHVVYAEGAAGTVITSTTILDGFTITKGHANGQPENNQGGGLYCNGIGSGNECSPSLSNLIFQENTASFWGGGIYNRGDSGVSSPSLTNISFFDNTADRGAAIYNYGANGVSSPSLTNVSFSGNSADRGGAVYSYGYNGDSSPNLVNTVLWGDNASIGSEIYNDSATPIISNSLLQGGIGSIFNDGSSNVTDGGNNIDVNPQFVDAPNGDLRLQVGSPA
ncbi:MAG: hypothetical protein KDE48_17430, partial [Anaerolineales bacterium]|nr:hypothetical protein [Anaerolineales bacterium]